MKTAVLFNFHKKKANVIGGGEVGLRRAQKLKEAGAEVTLITPVKRPEHKEFKVFERTYHSEDLDKCDIVVAATDDKALNDQIVKDAHRKGIFLINSVTESIETTFSFPAVINLEEIQISIDTGGTSPAFSKILKEKITALLNEEMVEHFRLLKEARKIGKTLQKDSSFFKELKDLSPYELKTLINQYDEKEIHSGH